MTEHRVLARVRAANPVPVAVAENDELWQTIVAGPGDPRLLDHRPGRRGMRGLRVRARRLPLVLLLVVATGAGGAAGWLGAFGQDSPTTLFSRDPAAAGAPGSALWHETLRAGSVRRAETFAVPGVGPVQLWTASTAQHGVCTALRLPDGVWAGSGASPLDAGSTVPGCMPTREQVNHSMPHPVYAIDGLDYAESVLRGNDGRFWRIEYGVVSVRGRAAEVVDALSGIRARVVGGRYFALVLPIAHPGSRQTWRLFARDAAGRLLTAER
jgi:hypothetical protein